MAQLTSEEVQPKFYCCNAFVKNTPNGPALLLLCNWKNIVLYVDPGGKYGMMKHVEEEEKLLFLRYFHARHELPRPLLDLACKQAPEGLPQNLRKKIIESCQENPRCATGHRVYVLHRSFLQEFCEVAASHWCGHYGLINICLANNVGSYEGAEFIDVTLTGAGKQTWVIGPKGIGKSLLCEILFPGLVAETDQGDGCDLTMPVIVRGNKPGVDHPTLPPDGVRIIKLSVREPHPSTEEGESEADGSEAAEPEAAEAEAAEPEAAEPEAALIEFDTSSFFYDRKNNEKKYPFLGSLVHITYENFDGEEEEEEEQQSQKDSNEKTLEIWTLLVEKGDVKYIITITTVIGLCLSGWTTASWAYMEVQSNVSSESKDYMFDPQKYTVSLTINKGNDDRFCQLDIYDSAKKESEPLQTFLVDRCGSDDYYPSGRVDHQINSNLEYLQ